MTPAIVIIVKKNLILLLKISDYLGSSIEDEYHLALYIKDTVDDIDADSGTTFRRWMQTMIGNGNPIDWYEIV